MSIQRDFNMEAGASIEAYRCLKMDATNPESEVIHTSADTDSVIAVSTNAATTDDPQGLKVELWEVGKVVTVYASAAVTIDTNLAPTTAGGVKTAQTGDMVCFRACETMTGAGNMKARMLSQFITD